MYEPGDIIGGCRLLRRCGEGAFGAVFLAENATTHRRCALKILPKTGRQWRRELAALVACQEKCRHDNLLRIHHVGQNDDCIFYTMDAADDLDPAGDYVPDTLGNRMRRRGRLAADELRPILGELLDGLEALHDAGLLHRDIKPDNVLFVGGRAVLGDVGLVTEADGASFAGTRGFISPAVWKGERGYEPRDDLYALGMTIYCALSGNEPRGDLELPRSLTFSGCSDLIRAYNAVLDDASPVRSVADLRRVLAEARPGGVPARIRYARYGIALAAVAAAVVAVSVAARRAATPSAPPQTSGRSDAVRAAELAAAMEREWRACCRVREREAGGIVTSPLDISQGGGDPVGKNRARAAERIRAVRQSFAEEERRIPELKRFAELAVRYFGDVADGDAPAVRALDRHDAAVRERIGDPGFLKGKYADVLIGRGLGWPTEFRGKVAEFAHYVDGLPPAERRLWRRRMVFVRLRGTILNGGSLLAPGGQGSSAAGLERELAAIAGYLDKL